MLKGGEKELLKLKEDVQILSDCRKEVKALEVREKEEYKQREKKNAEIEKLITENEKKAKKAVEEPFDKTVDDLKKNKAEKEAEKEKERKEEIRKQQENETGDLRERKEKIQNEIKEIAREDKIPSIGVSKFFLMLYYPKTFVEHFIRFFGSLVLLFGVSFGIYRVCFVSGNKKDFIIVFEGLIILALLFYMLLNKTLKEKHLEAFERINVLRREKNKTSSEIRQINKQIANVSEEELGLQEYNEEIELLEKKITECKKQKELALDEFERNIDAKQAREREVWNEKKQEWDTVVQNYEAAENELSQKKAELEEKENKLHEKYEELSGEEKDIFKPKVIDDLLSIMKQGEAKTIEEALKRRKEGKK